MKTVKGHITLFITIFVMIASMSTISANAATVYLKSAQKSAVSSTVYGYNKVFGGSNSSDSAYSVYFIAKYKKGGIWYKDTQRIVAKGKFISNVKTSALSKERDWHLKLNPEGANHYGCIANGYILND